MMMNKNETLQYLTDHGVTFELLEHAPVYNMDDLAVLHLPHPEWDAKNLFVRDDKKRNYYLITVRGEKRVNLNEFRKQHGLRGLTFASPEELMTLLHLSPGSVTPLGLLNDTAFRVQLFLDASFAGNIIAVHPNDNAATVWLPADDLARILREHGSTVRFVQLS